jgi:hypothetical protein
VNALILLAATTIGCFVFSSFLYLVLGVALPFGSDGTPDFIQYWSAWSLLRRGLNPYDGALMHAVQLEVGQSSGVTTMMWNPPWVPVLLAPVLSLPFQASALCWFVCNLGFIAVIAALTPRALGYAAQPPWLYGIAVCFLPFIDCLQWGQLSLLITAGFVVFLHSARLQNYFTSGLALVLLSIKPHLFLLFAVAGIAWLSGLQVPARNRFILGALTGLSLILCAMLVLSYDCFWWWIDGIRSPATGYGVIPVAQWQTATLASMVRSLLNEKFHIAPLWPLWLFPCLGLAGALLFFLRHRRSVDWSQLAPPLICLGLLLASYGWLYDQSLLIVCQFFILCRTYASKDQFDRLVGVGGLLLIQVTMVILNLCTIGAQHYYTWVPVAFLGLLWLSNRRAKC